MPTNDTANEIRIDEAVDRIRAASDDTPELTAVFLTGTDEGIDYYLVVAGKRYNGREMLKVRYFALHRNNPAKDTWMKNGVTARTSNALERELGKALIAKSNGRGDDPITDDLTDSVPQ